MRKKLLGISILSAAIVLSTGITAFAGWTQDTNGWAYQRDDGSWVGCGWFTDPADNSVYYLDPDGYMMTDTRVEGFRLGADGRRVEKTEEEIQKEAEAKVKEASKPSPSKSLAAADLAAAGATHSAVTTTRLSYQAEMKKFMDTIYIAARPTLDASIKSGTTEDNMETTYRFSVNGNDALVCSLWKVSNKTNEAYKANALDLLYNRTSLPDDASIAATDTAFRNLSVAALGETTGNTLFDNILAENAKGNTEFTWEGNTDSGNAYTMNCKSGTISIQVTCSEKTAEQASEEAAASDNTADTTADTAAETVTTTKTITAGAAAETEATDDAAAADDATAADDAAATDDTAAADGTAAADEAAAQ